MIIKQILSILITTITSSAFALPSGFVYLKDIDNTILQDIRYFTANNFTAKPVPGYQSASCILTHQAATALHNVQQRLKKQSLGLKVYDCYRPTQAVEAFVQWSQDAQDQKMKKEYYPHVNKKDLFKLGYISSQSGHSRGSTVDLTIVKYDKGQPKELPMGTHFDFLDPASHPAAQNISPTAKKNRMLLSTMMQNAGFKPLSTEWWHFTLANEPFINQYFNFPVR